MTAPTNKIEWKPDEQARMKTNAGLTQLREAVQKTDEILKKEQPA